MATWNYSLSVQELVNLSEKQSVDCFTNPNYDFLPDQFSHFDSSLSSIVSSPAPNNNFFLPKLIENSRNLSQMMNNDLHKYRNPVSLPPVFPFLLAGKNQSPYSDGNSSVSELVKSGTKSSKSNCQSNSRKRKTASLGNSKEVMEDKANEIDNAKRSKVIEENGKVHGCGKKEGETKSGKNYSGEEKSEKPENGKQKPPKITKDYIHVRARRGQATDSHSLAERVRREKINERMKLLVDLVPGCNKATGKAMMLDEIINYVQALQRQVEFLSMKLASVNPETSSVEDRLVPNGLYSSKQQQAPLQLQNDASAVLVSQFPMNPLDWRSCLGMKLQISASCEDDLQSIVQKGISHNAQIASQSLGVLSKDI